MKTITTAFLCLFIFTNSFAQSLSLHSKVQVKFGSSWYKAEIIDIKNGQYKIHYDGYGNSWDEWVGADKIKQENTTYTSPTQQSNGKYQVGQKVEAFNITWYKATIIGFGSGDLAGYIKVHYDDYSSSSDQYLKESSIRLLKSTAAANTSAGPRNGRYIILSYGNVNNPITLGFFDLKGGTYIYYDAGKHPLGNGTYMYDAGSKSVLWKSGPLKDYGPTAGFEISREGKTHSLHLKYGTTASNSTDS